MKKDRDKNEGVEKDFYWENGLMVFTKSYHLKRGYCCGSGCRHCPYKNTGEDPGKKP
jgi:hypothetical protein